MQNSTNVTELFENVKAWGREKKIDNPTMQFAKVVEELGELAHEITRAHAGKDIVPSQEAVDAIGDILVTVIIEADTLGIEPGEALSLAWDTIKNRQGVTVNGSFVKEQ